MTARFAGQDRARDVYDRKVACWRAIVDWAKHRPWVMRAIAPMARGKGRWRFTDRWLDFSPRPASPDFTNWQDRRFAACWIGHATMLLRVDGVTILTDPVFSPRVGLGWGFGTFGPARMIAPACDIRGLPPIDLILISHAHFDHLDRPTLARLPKSSVVVCAAGLRDLLDDMGFGDVIELENNELFELSQKQLTVTAIAQRHWGARIVLDTFRSYCAFLIESKDGKRIIFGGDTAYQEHWKAIGEEGGVDLAILGIGAYDPWIEGHANPEQAWQMAMHAGARLVAPMHHSSFKLSREPMYEPLARFLLASGHRVADVVCRSMGEIWSGEP